MPTQRMIIPMCCDVVSLSSAKQHRDSLTRAIGMSSGVKLVAAYQMIGNVMVKKIVMMGLMSRKIVVCVICTFYIFILLHSNDYVMYIYIYMVNKT